MALDDRGITTPAAIGEVLGMPAAEATSLLTGRGGCRCRAEGAAPMTEIDPNAIGPDGTVRLRCYLPSADTVWFSAGCQGLASCGHSAPMGIRAAIRLMGPDATVRQLARRLRCSRCGNRRVGVTVHPDVRPAEAQAREGPRPETRAGLPD